ncbi:hypothetical protein GCM10027036_38720 [Flavihumibacter cheonanensis]|uniref:sugar-transfer associated ATP-grasp domain-containing protein n=1 Tax=Flavihumibacter cheonanensis TaxID=1442385 RepID=UPI001EF9A13C|nr:sugar-transfer associated ATP-grasp domain-containing protein [Flavihumibacter cheonanensis]MCG7753875.1 hypothetical protein [Flavihumibacter cheonanensis]
MKRFIYLGYYFYKMDWSKHNRFISYVSRNTSRSRISLFVSSILNSLWYNISILEYYQFHFYEIPNNLKSNYAGTGFMFEYQKLMNPEKFRKFFLEKHLFLFTFKKFIEHNYVSLHDLGNLDLKLNEILANSSKKFVLKSNMGQCGIGIEVLDTAHYDSTSIIERMKRSGNDLAEEFIVQHNELMRLSPSGLNTIRIFTQLNKKNEVDIIGCRLRISVNSVVDNLAAGNIAAFIDEQSGRVVGPGVYSDITREAVQNHPVTGVELDGFQIPFWNETINMIKEAALVVPECKSIGWDIAITNFGPELLEGNHDWCKLVWQLPAQRGLKHMLIKYLD